MMVLNSRESAVIGLGLALAATFSDSAKDSKVYGATAHERLSKEAEKIQEKENLSPVDEVLMFVIHFQAELINALGSA